MVQKYSPTQLINLINFQIFGDQKIDVPVVTEPSNKSMVEQLKEYEKLLDMDIITQKEFNKKKSELLK